MLNVGENKLRMSPPMCHTTAWLVKLFYSSFSVFLFHSCRCRRFFPHPPTFATYCSYSHAIFQLERCDAAAAASVLHRHALSVYFHLKNEKCFSIFWIYIFACLKFHGAPPVHTSLGTLSIFKILFLGQ